MRKMVLGAAAALLMVSPAVAQTQMQFPTAPWGGYAPTRIECGVLRGANFNTTADQPISISVPTGAYVIDGIDISAPSTSLTTAVGGFYTGAAKSGVAVVANSQAYSGLTTNAINTTGNILAATISTAGLTTEFNSSVLYLSLTTPQGAPATANIRVYCRAHY